MLSLPQNPLVLLLLTLTLCLAQYQQQQGVRVAPGVPPQQYNPNQVPQHQMHQPQHHIPVNQQIPQQQQQQLHQQQLLQQQQQQQLLQQQQQQLLQQQQQLHQVPGLPGQQQQQQQQQHQSHGHIPHGHGHEQARLMDASNVLQERAHIQEHMDVPIDTSQMSEQELQFHYFKMHDADNNNKLDGCELVKSLIHWHDSSNHDPKAGHAIPEPKIFNDEELIQMIDPILQNDDKNSDGMIDYMEFSLAQANAAARAGAAAGGTTH